MFAAVVARAHGEVDGDGGPCLIHGGVAVVPYSYVLPTGCPVSHGVDELPGLLRRVAEDVEFPKVGGEAPPPVYVEACRVSAVRGEVVGDDALYLRRTKWRARGCTIAADSTEDGRFWPSVPALSRELLLVLEDAPRGA